MSDPTATRPLSNRIIARLVPARFIAAQLRRPSGRFGRWVMTHGLDEGNAPLLEATLERLELTTAEALLDVGFGGGGALRRAAARFQGALYGADFSPDVVLAGHRRLRDLVAEGRLNLVTADVAQLPLRSELVDRILTANTIYFWPDLVGALHELHRVLAPGGRVAFAYTGREKMDAFGAITRHGFRTFLPPDLEGPLQAAGFEAIATDALEGPVTQGDFVTVATRA